MPTSPRYYVNLAGILCTRNQIGARSTNRGFVEICENRLAVARRSRRDMLWLAGISCAVQDLLLIERAHVAVCLSQKVANSEIGDYLRWMEIGAPRVCPWGPTSVLRAKEMCRSRCTKSDAWSKKRCSRLRRPEPLPLVSCMYTPSHVYTHVYTRGSPSTPQVAAGRCGRLDDSFTLFVPLRDPLSRMLCVFHSKYRPPSNSSAGWSEEKWRDSLPSFSTDPTRGPAFIRYLDAVTHLLLHEKRLKGHVRHVNPHLVTQADQCLAAPMELARNRSVRRIPVPIDRPHKGGAGLNVLSEALGAAANASFSSLMRGPYHYREACYSPVLKGQAPDLMGRIARVLAPSYAALRSEFGIHYKSEAAVARAANSREVRLCTASYRLFARNASNESWVLL